MPDLYAELGVAKDADAATIKRAHRKRVSKTHPDVSGGDAEAFRKAQHAYLVLADPERRKRYDETGDEGEQGQRSRSPEEMEAEEATQILGALVAAMISDPGTTDHAISHTDFAAQMRAVLESSGRTRKSELAQTERQIVRAEKMAKRWRKKKKRGDKAPDLIAAMFASQIAGMRQRIEAIQRAERVNDRVLAMVDAYEYEHDPAPPASPLADLGIGGFIYSNKGGWR